MRLTPTPLAIEHVDVVEQLFFRDPARLEAHNDYAINRKAEEE
jgi:hypothetical protein